MERFAINRKAIKVSDRLKAGYKGEWVFVSRHSRTFKSIRTAFTNACKHANLPDVAPHALRNTLASRLGMQGAGDRTLQALGRWKEPKMIRRYLHLSEAHLKEAVEMLAEDSPVIFTTPAGEAQSGVAAKLNSAK
jgi:integrase